MDTKVMNCPKCGHVLDAAVAATEGCLREPDKNDISVCAYCFNINIYDLKDKKLFIRECTPDELSEVMLQAPELYTKIEGMRRHLEETGENPILRAPGDGQ